jgi:cytochrome P450 family 6
LDEITAQVIVFFTGGFETTSTTMSFCLYELAKNKSVQVRLRSELDAVLSQHGGNITYEAVNEMKYLDAVISGEAHIFILKDVGKCKVVPVPN